MSAFYDQASLVVVPSGYKSGKIYAQKPLTTDGQLTFTRASTATRVNASGLIETVASGVPRLDYTNSTCPKLLLEPQRSNLLTASADFPSSWSQYQNGTGSVPVVTSNNATAPDGTMTADTVVFNSGAGTTTSDSSLIGSSLSVAAGDYTMSFYARVTSGTAKIVSRHVAGGNYTTINLTTQWQRFSWTENNASTGSVYPEMGIRRGLSNEPLNSTATVQLWGIQLEAGSYATSYIPTTTAAVTRVADDTSKTGISSLIGQTEGTLFVELPLQYLNFDNYRGIISISDGTFDNGAFVFVNNAGGTSNQYSSVYRTGGSTVASFQASNLSSANIGTTYKIAIAYKANDFVFYINGVQIGSDNSGSISGTISRLDLGSIGYTGLSTIDRQTISQALLFKTRLTNAQLAELTTL
jgi:hypothetical protein